MVRLAQKAMQIAASSPTRKAFRPLRLLRNAILFVLIVFILPALLTIGWWQVQDRPPSWRAADWSSSGVLPEPATDDAAIYVLAARTGGLKGALSVHSWIVTKTPGEARYRRYDKVGWGTPIRVDSYAADGRWYSNEPTIVHAVEGAEAEALLPQFEAAIAAYPHSERGGYRIWPGPNSNSFVAWVLDAVPGFGGRLPPNATGRDYASDWLVAGFTPDGRDFRVTLFGMAGVTVGAASGLELHLAGLVAGFDFARPALKVPGYGLLPLWPAT